MKSKRGVEFRRWANRVLKDYIIMGYAVNDDRINQLKKSQVMKRARHSLDARQVLSVIENYNVALDILDDYDHQSMKSQRAAKLYTRLHMTSAGKS